MTVATPVVRQSIVRPTTGSAEWRVRVGPSNWSAPDVRALSLEQRILRENQAPYTVEPEDAALVHGDLLPQLIAEARKVPPSADWERDLNDL